MPDRTILITGASGFVGRHVIHPLLARGYTIHAVSRTEQHPEKGVTWHTVDLLRKKERNRVMDRVRPQTLLHLAWYAEHGKFWHAPDNALWQTASIDLFAYSKATGVRRIVGVGSCAEYDWNRSDTTPWKENDPCRPHTPYGKAKLAVFEALRSSGVRYAWGRIFHLFGAGEHPDRLVSLIIHALNNNREARCTSGKQVRDFMDVRDVGEALAALVDSDVAGAVNIASGEGTSVAELALMIGRLMQKQELIRLGALSDRPDDPPYIVANIHRLKHEIAFAPSHQLEQRIIQRIEQII